MSQEKLHNINNSGFKVPENYFDTLEDRLFTQAKLKASADSSGFTMPENYLNTLEDNILSQVSEKETAKVIPLFSRKNLLYASSIAAAITLLFTLSIQNTKPMLDGVDNETVESYLLNEDIDLYEIASTLTAEDLAKENFKEVKIDETTFEDYILSDVDLEGMMTN
ncbi:hypothetical protein RBH94_10695 [Aestuariibaculum sp. YM273]|uniref:hypothetical protein n=1 Tax=Aestuariibaculum sp. YM273 TaxID=3070659 RepID=UPI0027DE96CB|nr:hypothetical protein [Aestuariibaculum sp. YM273]WMI64528.1 hypothetical protein RBH94_10695 [Aestuariibaculum sp. YM273]